MAAVNNAPRETDGMWIILSMAGPRTLAVAASLTQAGFEVWTPARAIRRPAPGQRRALVLGRRRRMVEVDRPILPGFVFVGAEHLDELAQIAVDPASAHPRFAIFQLAGRAPLIAESAIAGLRGEEARAAAAMEAVRDAESQAEARRIRAEFMRTERARRAAMRRERRNFAEGARVEVTDMPSMSGMVGVVLKANGTSAMIDFGGRYPVKVEAWRVIPFALMSEEA